MVFYIKELGDLEAARSRLLRKGKGYVAEVASNTCALLGSQAGSQKTRKMSNAADLEIVILEGQGKQGVTGVGLQPENLADWLLVKRKKRNVYSSQKAACNKGRSPN
eukprot:1155041-Pelagomonas_calceolata.AAC.1